MAARGLLFCGWRGFGGGIWKFENSLNAARERFERERDLGFARRRASDGFFTDIFDGRDEIGARFFFEAGGFRNVIHRARDSGQ